MICSTGICNVEGGTKGGGGAANTTLGGLGEAERDGTCASVYDPTTISAKLRKSRGAALALVVVIGVDNESLVPLHDSTDDGGPSRWIMFLLADPLAAAAVLNSTICFTNRSCSPTGGDLRGSVVFCCGGSLFRSMSQVQSPITSCVLETVGPTGSLARADQATTGVMLWCLRLRVPSRGYVSVDAIRLRPRACRRLLSRAS